MDICIESRCIRGIAAVSFDQLGGQASPLIGVVITDRAGPVETRIPDIQIGRTSQARRIAPRFDVERRQRERRCTPVAVVHHYPQDRNGFLLQTSALGYRSGAVWLAAIGHDELVGPSRPVTVRHHWPAVLPSISGGGPDCRSIPLNQLSNVAVAPVPSGLELGADSCADAGGGEVVDRTSSCGDPSPDDEPHAPATNPHTRTTPTNDGSLKNRARHAQSAVPRSTIHWVCWPVTSATRSKSAS